MTPESISIREAVRGDLPAILQLYAQPSYDDGRILEEEQAGRIFERCSDYPFYRFFIAQKDDEIVGVYGLLIMDNLGHLGTPSAIVEGVAVSPIAQGLGIGSQMMRHAIDWAAERGCYKLALSSNDKRVRAHEFYEKLGFVRHGVSFSIVPSD